MSSPPTISIIIPTLQEEKLISRTLEQFTPRLRQEFNLEIIVSDGGSNDRTVSIAQQHADKVIVPNKNSKQNISIGRNIGAKAAHGEILIFFNADTIVEDCNTFFEKIIIAIQGKNVVAATCNVHIYPEEQTFSDRIFHGFYNWHFSLLNAVGMGMGRGECHVLKREMFCNIGGYDETIAAGEDYDLFVRLRRKGKVAFLRSLTVFESPRRYRKYGYLFISLLWFLNAFTVFFFHRSMLDEWKPVR